MEMVLPPIILKLAVYLGVISGGAFVIIIIGDAFVSAFNKIAVKTVNKRDDLWAIKISFYWGCVKDVWDSIREALDKVSIYSRPKKEKNDAPIY